MGLNQDELNAIKSQSEKAFNLLSCDHDLNLWFELDKLLGYKLPFSTVTVENIDHLLSMDVDKYMEYVKKVAKITNPEYRCAPIYFEMISNPWNAQIPQLPFPILGRGCSSLEELDIFNKKYDFINNKVIKALLFDVELCQLKIHKKLTLTYIENSVKEMVESMKTKYEHTRYNRYKQQFIKHEE